MMDQDQKEWFRELNAQAEKRHLDSQRFPIREDEFDTRFKNGSLDGWLDAYWEGLSPSQALDSARLTGLAKR
jgi:hypothetical protein